MDSQQQYADAMRAFDAYYGARRRVLGCDWPAKRYAEHRSWGAFLKVAARCAADHRDVERFVEVAVSHCPKNGDQLVPNDLLQKWAEAAWAVHVHVQPSTVGDTWSNLVRLVLQMQRDGGASDEAILLSAYNVQFPAWFRVFYPETLSDRIIERFGATAVGELQEARSIVRFLRAAMPEKVEAFEKRMGVLDGLLA